MKKFNHVWLPYMGALVQAGLFALAGYHYFQLGPWGALVGLGVGAVVSFSLAVASSKISEISEKRKPLARLALLVMLCLSPATIALSMFAPSHLATAIAWAMDTDIAIVLAGAIAGKSLVAQEPAASQPKPKAKREKPVGEPAEPAKPLLFCSVAGCERSKANPQAEPFGSQAALNAHQRKHKRIIGYTASFEPITKDQVEGKKGAA